MVYESISRSIPSMFSPRPITTPPQWPLTPPDHPDYQSTTAAEEDACPVATALHVISTERAAIAHLERLYQTDARAQQEFVRAVDRIACSVRDGGKLVICGVGKSGKIGQKIEATMNSLGIYSAFLHPTEALHGDLGLIRPNDTMLLISFSGRSPELLALLPHIPATIPIIALTAHTQSSACPLLSRHSPSGMGILLPAPIHEDEKSSLGLSAPTSSTTVALCLGDALAIATARKLHTAPGRGPAEVFRSFHPGGAIGAAAAGTPLTNPPSGISSTEFDSPASSISVPFEELANGASTPRFTLQPIREHWRVPLDMLVPLDHIPIVCTPSSSSPSEVRLLDILLAAIQHPTAKSWVFLSSSDIIPPRRVRALLTRHTDVDERLCDNLARDPSHPLAVNRRDWLLISYCTPLAELRQLASARSDAISVIGVLKDVNDPASCIGVMEAEDLLEA